MLRHATLQPTFKMDPDSIVFRKQSEILDVIKSKCLSTIEKNSMDIVSREHEQFKTPQKITFQTPKTPKQWLKDDMVSLSSKVVKEKAKHSVLFYRLLFFKIHWPTYKSNRNHSRKPIWDIPNSSKRWTIWRYPHFQGKIPHDFWYYGVR